MGIVRYETAKAKAPKNYGRKTEVLQCDMDRLQAVDSRTVEDSCSCRATWD